MAKVSPDAHSREGDVASTEEKRNEQNDQPAPPLPVHACEPSCRDVIPLLDLQLLHEAAHVPMMQIEVPQSIYGGVAFIPLIRETSGIGDWLQNCGLQYLLLVLQLSLSFFFIYTIERIYNSQLQDLFCGDCEEIHTELLCFCVGVHCAFILLDLEQSLRMCLLFFSMSVDACKSEYFKFSQSEGGPIHEGGGFGYFRKVAIVIFVLIPKITLAIFLLLYGSYFLASSSSNTDVLLNAVALCFVIDLDELAHEVFTPHFNKRLLAAMPTKTYNSDIPVLWKIWDRYGLGLATKIATIALFIALAQQLPSCGKTDGALAPGRPSDLSCDE